MNTEYLMIVLKGFWEVICPDWWTLGLLIAALLAFAAMKIVYSRSRVSSKNALQQVGKRWQMAGVIILLAGLLIYVAELLITHNMYGNIVANLDSPADVDLIFSLNKNQYDFARHCRRNQARMKKEAEVEAVKDEYSVPVLMSIAERKQLMLARKYSQLLRKTGNQRFYPAAADSPNHLQKYTVVARLLREYKYLGENDERRRQLVKLAGEEFIAPENQGAVKKLEAMLRDEFTRDTFNTFYWTTPAKDWQGFSRNTSKNLVENGTADARDEIIANNTARLAALFGRKIQPDNPDSATYERYLKSIRQKMDNRLRIEMIKMFDTDNIWEIRLKVIAELEKDPAFRKMKFKEQLVRFNNAFGDELGKQWKARAEGVINDFFSDWETEALFYNNDQVSFNNLSATGRALNSRLLALYKISNYLHDFFWLLVLAIIVLIVFWLRGAKIVRAGNPRIVKNKIHNA